MNRRKGLLPGTQMMRRVMLPPCLSGKLVSDFKTHPPAVFERLSRYARTKAALIPGATH
jgi:hypothetical protein